MPIIEKDDNKILMKKHNIKENLRDFDTHGQK